jgi:uncharacterized cupin superfamily protein
MRAGASSMRGQDSANLNRRRATVRQFRQEIAAMPAPIVHSQGAELELQDSPIEPSWIISGDPKTRARELSRSEDNIALTWTWDCTAGEFRWYFDLDETVQILEGAVTVTDSDGRVYDLKTGDSAYFPAGHWTVWKVGTYVRKVAFCRAPMPSLATLFARVQRKIAHPGRPSPVPEKSAA